MIEHASPIRSGAQRAWTRFEDIVDILRRRWETGKYLREYAAGSPWNPVSLPVRGPTAAQALDGFEEVRRWVEVLESRTRAPDGAERFAIEYRQVGGRNLGTNALPARIRIDTFDQLCKILDTSAEVRVLDSLVEGTASKFPELGSWIQEHPLRALRHSEIWEDVLATVAWIAGNSTECRYLRQIDVDGVDTKFVETHRKLLDDLLTSILPPDRFDPSSGDFARRFKFLTKPSYTRLRILDEEVVGLPIGVSEMTLRSDELALLEPGVSAVFVVENEITYLAFPPVRRSILVFGSGFALGSLGRLDWLHRRPIVYWGDIDTHGFAILDQLREQFDGVSSMLMDGATLLAHRRQWVTESNPSTRILSHLTDSENQLYRDLIEGCYGNRIRLEQERVRFSLVREALREWE